MKSDTCYQKLIRIFKERVFEQWSEILSITNSDDGIDDVKRIAEIAMNISVKALRKTISELSEETTKLLS